MIDTLITFALGASMALWVEACRYEYRVLWPEVAKPKRRRRKLPSNVIDFAKAKRNLRRGAGLKA